MPQPPATKTEIKRVGKFGLVGIANTLIDFGIYNFASKFLGWTLIEANTLSTTVAMTFSFFANRQLVFEPGRGSMARQAAVFFAVTAFGLYIIQNGIIHLLTSEWRGPLEWGTHIVRQGGIKLFSDAFWINNGAKAVATVASLTWNYIMYKKVVFR
jgi:putative flippase GtrA